MQSNYSFCRHEEEDRYIYILRLGVAGVARVGQSVGRRRVWSESYDIRAVCFRVHWADEGSVPSGRKVTLW